MASATGPSDARFETTAAWQAAETSSTQLQSEVERNAQQAHQVAEQAANSAQFKQVSTGVAVERLEEGLSVKTNDAVAEGQSNVASATSAAGSYVQQAREIVGGAMVTAASYLPSSVPGSTASSTDTEGNPIAGNTVASSLQSAAGAAVEAAKTALSAAQPHVERLATAARSTAEAATQSAYQATGAGQASSKPEPVQPTTAPLESSGGVVGGPYPATTTNGKSNVASV
ncbi:uncharacterized protein PHACADRAFT_204495 [Phanerochaete carnosa HHB-10118-sp]|uniref:Uncharacterized protein n=1 Tax=Phanerochaete carnosa (strain HHB-10118-sp) TaxID=650164 RepID=K5WQ44_PHACS|nr:uncharacterized protein PHACADRAFT_204495 [Phanerochaete carnosa HHB-10118-sp]EKM61329.1 hypothetical protein PHACADRAFT_204495 [Phanerochaete carnosa HHB-10118-sp]